MGIDYDVVFVFGVSYNYNELQNYIEHENIKKLAEEINDNNLITLWSENNYIVACPYFDADEKDCSFLLGYKLDYFTSLKKMRDILKKENEIKQQIREFSIKYNIINKEHRIGFLVKPNIY